MKIQKAFIIGKKNLKINIWKINIGEHCHYSVEYRGAAHSISN